MTVWPWTRCSTGDGRKAVNEVNNIPYCAGHARKVKQMGGKSAAQEDRPGKAATTRRGR